MKKKSLNFKKTEFPFDWEGFLNVFNLKDSNKRGKERGKRGEEGEEGKGEGRGIREKERK